MAENPNFSIVNVDEELGRSYVNYAMSVIIARALPDVRDGLKPVQRRILYAMRTLNLSPDGGHAKCAKICGQTSGDYHPHGEAVIYPTLVRMAQPWSMRYPLIDGQGNFGSIDGDSPAAMRYTEARITPLAQELMEDLDRETVEWLPNYSQTLNEPKVFPGKFPNLICNGSQGIAVGMATNIPPHNLNEIIDACCAVIDDAEVDLKEVAKLVKGADFPTGGLICGKQGIKDYLLTGRGSIKMRGRVGVEEVKGGKERIIVSEIPYNVNKATLIESIARLVNEKKIEDISDIRDE